MKILLVTGKLAGPLVKEILSKSKTPHRVDVIVLPISVIVLLSTENIAEHLSRIGIKKGMYDLIIIPGGCRGSAKIIEEYTGIPAVKGPIHANDLPLVLELDDPSKYLSPDKPADEVIRGRIIARNIRLLKELEESLSPENGIAVGNIIVPQRPPPIRVISEIVEAHLLTIDEIIDRINRYIDNGADIVSIGFEAETPHPDKVYEVIRSIKRELDIPVAIDSLIPSEIIKAVEAGVDLVLSIDLSNIDKVASYVIDTPCVFIPYDHSRKYLPKDPAERTSLLGRIVSRGRSLGIKYIIADLILEPPIIGDSFKTLYMYSLFKETHPKIPMLIGSGNIVELMDVDSVGVNALLVMFAMEIGISLVLTVEKSVKAQGSTREIAIASQMASLAYLRKTPPKDLGIDLLILKDKRRITMPIEKEGVETVIVKGYRSEYKLDPMGIFKIRVDYKDRYIDALYIGRKGKILIRGRSAEEISKYIVDNGLVSMLSHAIYLGRELAKAEEALRINKNYYQERPLFIIRKPLRVKRIAYKED